VTELLKYTVSPRHCVFNVKNTAARYKINIFFLFFFFSFSHLVLGLRAGVRKGSCLGVIISSSWRRCGFLQTVCPSERVPGGDLGEVFVLDNMLSGPCFVLPDNDGIDQVLVRLFISWQCSKSRSCLNKSDTTAIPLLMQLLLVYNEQY